MIPPEPGHIGWIAPLSICVLLFIGNGGYGTLIWVVMAELLPPRWHLIHCSNQRQFSQGACYGKCYCHLHGLHPGFCHVQDFCRPHRCHTRQVTQSFPSTNILYDTCLKFFFPCNIFNFPVAPFGCMEQCVWRAPCTRSSLCRRPKGRPSRRSSRCSCQVLMRKRKGAQWPNCKRFSHCQWWSRDTPCSSIVLLSKHTPKMRDDIDKNNYSFETKSMIQNSL